LAGSAALTLAPSVTALRAVPTPPEVRGLRHKRLIVLWLDGGLPHTHLWSIHAGQANQGPFQPIKTTAEGIEISEVMPKVAEQFKHLSIVHTLDSREGDMTRATARMLTGMPLSTTGVRRPHIGSVVARFAASPDAPLSFVSTGGTAVRIGAGHLGPAYAPLLVQNPGQAPENIRPPQIGDAQTSAQRALLRGDLLMLVEDEFRAGVAAPREKKRPDAAQQHRELVVKALDISARAETKLFEFDAADNKSLERYGNSGFGRGCLLARKLVEAGVSAVQVDLGGWNMHGNVSDGLRRLAGGVLDPAMAGLVHDLAERGLLKDTLVVCLSQYGKLPALLNQPTGLRVWSKGWDVVLGGAGIKPGVAYGTMKPGGDEIQENPVSVEQLHATLYTALGVSRATWADILSNDVHRHGVIVGEKQNPTPIKALLR
jgi:hypothetical protein